jgi:hypothetical protein
MSSPSPEDAATIAQYAAANAEFEEQNAKARRQLATTAGMASAVASKCARTVQLTSMIEDPPPEIAQKIEEHKTLAGETRAKALLVSMQEADFAIKRCQHFQEYEAHLKAARRIKTEYTDPLLAEKKEISSWFGSTPSASAVKIEMIRMAVKHNQKLRRTSDPDALIAEHIAPIYAEILAQIDANARALAEHDASKLAPDRFATAADFAEAIRAATPDCSICFGTILAPTRFTSKCGHAFHARCIDGWRQKGGLTCPNCRALYE